MSDLFVRLTRYTSEKEDFFTECLAAALRDDTELASRFVGKLCERDKILAGKPVTSVETQVCFPEGHSCLDMVLQINGRFSWGVENKLESPEGVAPTGKRQLEKYRDLVDRLAFITGYHTIVSEKVLCDPRYLRPVNGRAQTCQ